MTDATSRKSPRLNHEVVVSVSSDLGTVNGWGTNLSMDGVFVNAAAAPPKGTAVEVLVHIPGLNDCKLKGRVAWSQAVGAGVAEPGMGIEFLATDPPTRELLGQMVERLAQDLAEARAVEG